MDALMLTCILLSITSLCCFGTGIAAFRRYSMTQSERLFIIGMSMIMAAVGIVCGALDSLPALRPYSLEWSWYFGTSVGFFLLFLSSIMKSAEQFRILKRWSIIAGAVVIIMIALSTVLPDISENQNAILWLNTLRVIICSLVFFRYLILYTSKGTRFSLLLCLAFLFLAVGYITFIVQALSTAFAQLLVLVGIIRLAGDVLLFVAFVAG
jgi:hypothetical protein